MNAHAAGFMLSGDASTKPRHPERLVIRRREAGQVYEWQATCEFCRAIGRRFTLAAHRQPAAFEMARRHAFLTHGVTL